MESKTHRANPEHPWSSAEAIQLVYAELRAVAGSYFRNQAGSHTLQPTALVHEAFLKLCAKDQDGKPREWEGRAHFLAVAASAMRQVLIDHARRGQAEKRGGGVQVVTLAEADASALAPAVDVLELDESLTGLERVDARASRVAVLKLFGGLTTKEIAQTLSVSDFTVENDWRAARAFLASRISGDIG